MPTPAVIIAVLGTLLAAALTAAEAAGRGWAEAVHPEDQAPVLADWEAAIAA